MTTTDIFDRLKELQDILVQKYDLEARIEDAPKQLGTQDELLARLKKEFISENADYEAVRSRVLELRSELDEAVRSRESGEKGMDSITTHREYEALDKQISEAAAKESDIRRELQKEEKNLAELNERMKSSEDMINSQEAELASGRESLDKEISEYRDRLSELKLQEDRITPDLDQEILFKFQRIIQRNSDGIVAVKKNVCTGCHMILPAQFANTVREGESILFCPYCSRILYYEDVDDSSDEETYFKMTDVGSLADFDASFDDEDEEYDDDSDENFFDDEEDSAGADDDEEEEPDADSDDDAE